MGWSVASSRVVPLGNMVVLILTGVEIPPTGVIGAQWSGGTGKFCPMLLVATSLNPSSSETVHWFRVCSRTIADKGNLVARIRLDGSDTPGTFVDRKVTELRVPKRFGDNSFKAQGGDRFLGSNTRNLDANFEIQLESQIISSTFLSLRPFKKGDGFNIEWFELDLFLICTDGAGKKIEGFYHSTVDSALVPNRLEKVESAVGNDLAVDSSAQHVLEDPAAQFQTDLQSFFDAGDKITVTLPYGVIDATAKSAGKSTEVAVTGIISQSKLQLGLLKVEVANKSGEADKKMGPLPIGPYKVFVRRATGIQLLEAAIRKRIKNPPLGAFSVVDINAPEQQLVQQTGVFQMEKGVHFKE